MVRTRATYPERNNPPPKTRGPSNDAHFTTMEARIAQMSNDMEALTEQNLRLLGQFSGGLISEESDKNEGDEGVLGTTNSGITLGTMEVKGLFTRIRRRG